MPNSKAITVSSSTSRSPCSGISVLAKRARTTEGRQKLASWLKKLENLTAKYDPSEPMAEYDVTWMWEELGVAELRQ